METKEELEKAAAEITERMKGPLPNMERTLLHLERKDLRAKICGLDRAKGESYTVTRVLSMATKHVKTHHGNPLNDGLDIQTVQGRGPGNAYQCYRIIPFDLEVLDTAREPYRASALMRAVCDIRFQSGDPKDGINGVSNEALLAVVRDRLEDFQAGPFACQGNAEALEAVTKAMDILAARTRERAARGVEGKPIP